MIYIYIYIYIYIVELFFYVELFEAQCRLRLWNRYTTAASYSRTLLCHRITHGKIVDEADMHLSKNFHGMQIELYCRVSDNAYFFEGEIQCISASHSASDRWNMFCTFDLMQFWYGFALERSGNPWRLTGEASHCVVSDYCSLRFMDR